MALNSIANNIQKTPNNYGVNTSSAQAANISMPQSPTSKSTLERIPASDSASLSANKKTISTEKKVGIGVAIAAVIGGAVAFAVSRGRNTKSVENGIKQLAEHIEFAPAKTVEEAVQFGKQKLGIKEYDKELKDIDILNWVNEGLTEVNNTTKGKAKMPELIVDCGTFKGQLPENHFAAVPSFNTELLYNDVLNIHQKQLQKIDDTISEELEFACKTNMLKKVDDINYKISNLFNNGQSSKDLIQLITDYEKEGKKFNFKQKMKLYDSLIQINDANTSINRTPINIIKQILKNEPVAELFKKNNKFYAISELEKMPKEQQTQILIDMLNEGNFVFDYSKGDSLRIIKHEMGHLQHIKTIGKAQFGKMNAPKIRKDKFGNEVEIVPELTKEFINNPQKLQIAGSVSEYAQENPVEFVAETYSHMINGKSFSDDVMNLYEKYNGPKVF